jgi:hypothetical protein
MKKEKYFISIQKLKIEVSKSEWKKWERCCGFIAKPDLEFATLNFGFTKDGIEIRGWRKAQQ